MTTKSEFRRQVMDQGVQAAYDGLMRVLTDPRASATALASASRTMLEAGGVLKVPEDPGEKQPFEMTADELQAKIARLRAEAKERERPLVDIKPHLIAQTTIKSDVFD